LNVNFEAMNTEEKTELTLLKYKQNALSLNEAKQELLNLHSVSQQRELLDLLTEIANSDTLYSNTRHRMIARKLLKSNCG